MGSASVPLDLQGGGAWIWFEINNLLCQNAEKNNVEADTEKNSSVIATTKQ